MNFEIFKSSTLKINDTALSIFERYKQNDPSKPESGGILLGKIVCENNDVIIDFATEPQKSDIRKRFLFFREKKAPQKIVNKHWRNSNGIQIYLGEWHTHPEDIPHPSNQDYKNWRNIFRRAKYEQDFLIFIIVGIQEVGCWLMENGFLNKDKDSLQQIDFLQLRRKETGL